MRSPVRIGDECSLACALARASAWRLRRRAAWKSELSHIASRPRHDASAQPHG